jgi:dTDP-4-amino-4,6-dideoxygalactose transaminase
VFVLEDACQAHGAVYKGNRAGALGHAAAFSFYPTKNMTVGGDGGMITTNDQKLADIIKKLRNCGRNVKDGHEEHDVVGYTARLNTVNAAIGIEQLKLLDGWNTRRREIAKKYHDALKGIEDIRLPPQPTREVMPVFNLYAIMTQDRNSLKKFLDSKGVDSRVHYWNPIHLQPIYRQLFGSKKGMLPITEKCSAEELSLPMFVDLKGEEVKYICDCIKMFFE